MGYSWHPMEHLGPPFLMVDEATFVIPKGGENSLIRGPFKFLFILDGSIEHEIDGIDGRHVLQAGDILIAPFFSRHTYINPSTRQAQSVHLVRMFLDREEIEKHVRRRVRKPEVNFTDFVAHHFQKVLQISGGIDNRISDLLNDLRNEADQRAIGFQHRVRTICTDLIVLVSRKIEFDKSSVTPTQGTPAAHLVIGAKEYIRKHLTEEITLSEIAWHVGKGEEHLARVFKRETGRTVFEYVRGTRIERAQTLILDPSLSLSEISERCGFHSPSFFSRTFRQLTGMSPSGYRRHMRAVLS